jgi:hypothetical protein
MKKSRLVKNYATSKIIKRIGLAFGLLYTSLILVTNKVVKQYQVNSNDFIVDINLFYTPETLYKTLALFPPELRAIYPRLAIVDTLVAVLYGLLGFLITKKMAQNRAVSQYFYYIPFLFLCAMTFDIVENIIFSIIFFLYPLKIISLAIFGKIMTLLKFSCLTLGCSSLVILFFMDDKKEL